MARRISMATRSELVETIVERYRSGSRGDKRLILDEFVAVTGYHRKHAIRVLRHRASKTPGNKRHSLRFAMAAMFAKRSWCCGGIGAAMFQTGSCSKISSH